jgi:hypothetical protein
MESCVHNKINLLIFIFLMQIGPQANLKDAKTEHRQLFSTHSHSLCLESDATGVISSFSLASFHPCN